MKQLRKSFTILSSVLAVTLSICPLLAQAQKDVRVINTPSEPVPVTGTVNVGNIVQFRQALPAGAFSLVGDANSTFAAFGPYPEGTNYAITSITFTNLSPVPQYGRVIGFWGACGIGGSLAPGPSVIVPARATVHLSYPQPFVLSALPGSFSCLAVDVAGTEVFVSGYRFIN